MGKKWWCCIRSETLAAGGRRRVSLLSDLDAFYLEHRACGDLTGEVCEETDGASVWMSCSCGGRLSRAVVPNQSTDQGV
jgi:hypothetical protein